MHLADSIHDGWLYLESIMIKRHGKDAWSYMSQGMQAAFYMGALTALHVNGDPQAKWKQCESGLQDALSIPNMRIVKNDDGTLSRKAK